MGFARTKIQPPRPRPAAIERVALQARLNAAVAQCRLVLLTAPAGFGKTAALASLVARQRADTALAWVSCDEDDDLQRLLLCLCAAVEPFDLPWRSDPNALAERATGSRGQRREAADELLNTLAAADQRRGLIVLDDLQRIEDPAVFEFLALLLPGLPSNWVLLLASRETPPLPLARLRVQDELAEFRDSDLRFDADEVAALLRATPLASGQVDAAQLLARTQGWAVGLRLVLNTLGSERFDARRLRSAALDRQVFDYLAAEVFADMPEALGNFMLRCSVLPELSAARCAAVTGDAQAVQRLDELEQRGLFVSVLDGPELTLRVHDLFREFLEDRLQRDHPGELPALLRRAAATEDDPLRRIGYLLRAGASEEARDTLCDIGPQMMTDGQVAAVQRLIEQFARALRDGPELQLLRSMAAWAVWDFDAMCEASQRSAMGFEARGEHVGALRARAYTAIALSGAYRDAEVDSLLRRLAAEPLLDDHTQLCTVHAAVWQALDWHPLIELAPLFERELALVEALDTALSWYHAAPVVRYLGAPGIVPLLARFARGAVRHGGQDASPLRSLATTLQALLQLWAGCLDEAGTLLQQAEQDARWLASMRGLTAQTQLCRSLLHALRGQGEPALAAVRWHQEWLDEQADGPRRRIVGNRLRLHEARLCALCGDLPRLRALCAALAQAPQADLDAPTRAQRALLPAYLADAEGRPGEAVALREQALRDERWLDRLGLGVETRLRQAAALLRERGSAAAAATLMPVLARTDDRCELAPVLLAGPASLEALAQADWRGQLDAAQRARLRQWAERASALRVPAGAAVAPPAGLSAREFEVLERIAAGDSNKLIARAFDLSPHTVKRHVANILDKLGLQSRGQAAAWLRARQR